MRLLGLKIGQSQAQDKRSTEKHNTYVHKPSGIRSHGSSAREVERELDPKQRFHVIGIIMY